MQALTPFLTLIAFAAWLYGTAILLVLIMQLTKVDFYNPIAQQIARFTLPVLKPFRVVFPRIQRFDTAALVVTLILYTIAVICVVSKIAATLPNTTDALPLGLIAQNTALLTAATVLDIYTITLVVHAIMSWFGAKAYYSAWGRLLATINEPLVSPIRRLISGLTQNIGIDLSPMVLLLGIFAIQSVLGLSFLAPLQWFS